MRPYFYTVVPLAMTLVGLASALGAPASASEIDPASAVRGSLGVSLDELAFGNGAGTAVFLLNAAFVLVFAALAFAARRGTSRGAGHIPFKPVSYFAG